MTLERPVPDDPPVGPAGMSAKIRLVFEHLLNERYAEATALYESLCASGRPIALAEHLDRKDCPDCLFLLGEAYEKQSRTEEALRFYEEVYALESERPSRPFLDALRERIRALRGG